MITHWLICSDAVNTRLVWYTFVLIDTFYELIKICDFIFPRYKSEEDAKRVCHLLLAQYSHFSHSCAYFPGSVGRGQTQDLTCTPPKTGRYVYVTLRGTDYLTLCEVEVLAVKGGRSFHSVCSNVL